MLDPCDAGLLAQGRLTHLPRPDRAQWRKEWSFSAEPSPTQWRDRAGFSPASEMRRAWSLEARPGRDKRRMTASALVGVDQLLSRRPGVVRVELVDLSVPLPNPQPRAEDHPQRQERQEGSRSQERLPILVSSIEADRAGRRGLGNQRQKGQGRGSEADRPECATHR